MTSSALLISIKNSKESEKEGTLTNIIDSIKSTHSCTNLFYALPPQWTAKDDTPFSYENIILNSKQPQETILHLDHITSQSQADVIYVIDDIVLCNLAKYVMRDKNVHVIYIHTQKKPFRTKFVSQFPELATINLDGVIITHPKNVLTYKKETNTYEGTSPTQIVQSIQKILSHTPTPYNGACYLMGNLETSDKRLSQIIEHIVTKNAPVSFDIFDTLVSRPFASPADLFSKLQNFTFYECTLDTTFDIKHARQTAENEARKKHPDQEDITLNDIYETFSELYYIPRDVCQKIKEEEMRLEVQYCEKKELMHAVYKLAFFYKRDIFIVSDMYLESDAIKKILEKNDYHHYKALYVSSEYKKAKYTGNLFRIILEQHPHYKKALHIGDNIKSDVATCPIMAIYAPSSKQRFHDKNKKLWKKKQKTPHIKQACAIIANTLYDNPFLIEKRGIFAQSRFNFGYYGLGLYLTGLLFWSHEKVSLTKSDVLGCLSRDGYLLYKAYDFLQEYIELPYDVLYIPSSRYISHQSYPLYTLASKTTQLPLPYEKLLDLYLGIKYDDLPKEERLLDKKTIITNIPEVISYHIKKEYKYEQEREKATLLYKKTFDKYQNIALYDIGYAASATLAISNCIQKKITNLFSQTDATFIKDNLCNSSFQHFFTFHSQWIPPSIIEPLLSQDAPTALRVGEDYNKEKNMNIEDLLEKIKLFTIQQSSLLFTKKFVKTFHNEKIHAESIFPAYLPLAYFAKHVEEHSAMEGITHSDPQLMKQKFTSTSSSRFIIIRVLSKIKFVITKIISFFTPTAEKILISCYQQHNKHRQNNNLQKYFYKAILFIIEKHGTKGRKLIRRFLLKLEDFITKKLLNLS